MRAIISILFSMTVLTLTACQNREQKAAGQEALPVSLTSVVKKEIVRPIHASGLLAAPREVALSFKTGGIVASISADEGMLFHKGDILSKLDEREVKAYTEQAAAGMDKAQRDAARIEKLYADSAATLEQLQNVRTALRAARAQYQIARFNLEKSEIRAPFAGRVLKRLLQAGEMTGPGTPVLLVGSNPSQPIIKAAVSDRDILRCKMGDRADVRFDAYPEQVFKGHIRRLAGTALPGSGVYEIEIALDKTNAKLLSGFVAELTIYPAQTRNLPVIPASALSAASGNHGYVFLFNNGTAKRQPVEIAAILDNEIAILKGLNAGQEIIDHGAAYLNDGQKVKLSSTKVAGL